MGRTFEALSRNRTPRFSPEEAEGSPTKVIPLVLPAAARISHVDADSDADSDVDLDLASADTALLDEFSHDNDNVPFIEVGGQRGAAPVFGPEKKPPPPPARSPVVVGAPLAKSETPRWSIAFFPLPEHEPVDARSIAAEIVAYHRPADPICAQYRALLAGMAAQQPTDRCPLTIFTTVGHEVEAATPLLNLAVTQAREENRRLLAIEANHQRPFIAGRLGVPSLPGLRELLNRTIPMSVAIHATAETCLFALPPGDPNVPVSNEAEGRLPAIVDGLRKRFDWLLVNGPEWGSGGAAEWAAIGDSVYLVVRSEQWDTAEVEAAHQAIVAKGGKLRGYIVLRAE